VGGTPFNLEDLQKLLEKPGRSPSGKSFQKNKKVSRGGHSLKSQKSLQMCRVPRRVEHPEDTSREGSTTSGEKTEKKKETKSHENFGGGVTGSDGRKDGNPSKRNGKVTWEKEGKPKAQYGGAFKWAKRLPSEKNELAEEGSWDGWEGSFGGGVQVKTHEIQRKGRKREEKERVKGIVEEKIHKFVSSS